MNDKEIIAKYRSAVTESSKAFQFLKTHRREIVREMGYSGWKQLTLNYRTYFNKDRKEQILREYERWVMTKTVKHNSDLTIGYNIVEYVHVQPRDEERVVEFMYNRLDGKIPKVDKYFLKKHFVLNYILTNIKNQRVE